MRSRCFAPRFVSRGRLPTLRDSVTPLPPVTLCRPTSGVWQDDSRALAPLTLLGEKTLLWAAVSVCPCRDPHDTAWVLCGVSTAAHQTQDVHGTLVHSLLTPNWSEGQRVSGLPLGLGNSTPARAVRRSKTSPLRLTRVTLKGPPVEPGESHWDSYPPLGAAVPLGTSLRGFTQNSS